MIDFENMTPKEWVKAIDAHLINEKMLIANASLIPDSFEVWNSIFNMIELSELFLYNNIDKLNAWNGFNWSVISCHQILSEDFMHQFRNKLDWEFLSIKQTMSESFIESHSNLVDWYLISGWKKLSDDFVNKWSHKLDIEQLLMYENNMYSRIELKK